MAFLDVLDAAPVVVVRLFVGKVLQRGSLLDTRQLAVGGRHEEANGKRQKANVKTTSNRGDHAYPTLAICHLPFDFCLLPFLAFLPTADCRLPTAYFFRSPVPSFTQITWLVSTSFRRSTWPLGHRTSTRSALDAAPIPKWRRRSFCEM